MAMLEKISLQIFQNADLLNLLIISITVYFLLKLIFRKNRYLTLIYIITAFFILSVYNLGSFKMPSSTYDPEYDNTEIILKASKVIIFASCDTPKIIKKVYVSF